MHEDVLGLHFSFLHAKNLKPRSISKLTLRLNRSYDFSCKYFRGPKTTCRFRYVARKQLDKFAEMGYTMLSGIENEFMLYQKGTKLPLHTGHDFCVTATTGKFVRFVKKNP